MSNSSLISLHKPPRILITAGPTREMLDPVRFISNLSTGEMGYSLAREAQKMHYDVTLISGPTALKPPRKVKFVPIISAHDLEKACAHHFPKNDILIMTAAVCDFTPKTHHAHKIHRTRTHEFHLKQTPDIVAKLGKKKGRRIVVGFCLETKDWIQSAKRKMIKKSLDGIVANFYTKKHVPFGARKITTALVNRKGQIEFLRHMPKNRIAKRLLVWSQRLRHK